MDISGVACVVVWLVVLVVVAAGVVGVAGGCRL